MEPIFEKQSKEVPVRVCGPSFLLVWFRDLWLRYGYSEIGEFPHFQTFSLFLILALFEDKQGSKSGGIDIWCFWHHCAYAF